MDATELLKRYAAGERSFPFANLNNADLSGANLSNADLSGANLSNADLSGANLSNADLSGANFGHAYLATANLSHANLSDAKLIYVKLQDANLSYANLIGANLSFADLSRTNLCFVNAPQTVRGFYRIIRAAKQAIYKLKKLSYIKESNDFLEEINLDDYTDFTGANLTNANLYGAFLTNANFSGANLSNICLIEADLTGADLKGNNLHRANLANAKLIKADLRGADLSDSNLAGADLTDAQLEGANIQRTILVKKAGFTENINVFAKNTQNLLTFITEDNEEQAKTSLILPFIKLLGYNIHDPEVVKAESKADYAKKRRAGKYKRVDYEIFIGSDPVMLIETKAVKQVLDDKDGQLANYFSAKIRDGGKVKIAIITNGVTYKFFSDFDKPNVMDNHPFYSFDVLRYEPKDVELIQLFCSHKFNLDIIKSRFTK
ncbi:pentapeptide repeat-containing protein [Coleofasciculus sp. FACHB-542]|uniref:pentapeptide repeat-containing protein n=1 Tax=Coleofasciculus sp. FACHB-542 TaxID=2692787 RepID=UPI001685DA8E|nr:pentapeptide repeat-containing protein [Coleofasciculus sp. FACHB-542]MBD2083528.1 pentapeptide repeat-containing protein [Coleofasciculus sp. FACHB-542]